MATLQSNPIPVKILDDELSLCLENARLAEIGGRSQIRSTDRAEKLKVDQIVGQVSTLALAKFLYGEELGYEEYIRVRNVANANPTKGDGGRDLLGLDVDVKGSLIRNLSKPLLDYNLPLRPHERHDGFVYVLSLVPPQFGGAFLMGWLNEQEITYTRETSGIFEGACLTKATQLNPMSSLTLEMINGNAAT